MTDPEVWVNEPTNYENQVLNSASDPEWQCTVQGRYQTFMDMPDHCQRKILESFDRGLDEIFGFAYLETYKIRWGTAVEKGSYGSTITTAQQAMQFALSITHKPASGGGTSSADSGYSHQSGEMQWDVQVNAGYDIIADNFTRLDASNPGDPNFGDNMQDFDDAVQAVRSILNENKGDNSCAKFFGGVGEDALNKIVAMVDKESFTPVNSQAGIKMEMWKSYNLSMPSTGYTTVSPASVKINTRGPFVSAVAKRIGSYPSATLASRVLQILHEMGHLVVTGIAGTVVVEVKVGKEKRKYTNSKPSFLLPIDGDDANLSENNTYNVEQACGGQINALDEKKS